LQALKDDLPPAGVKIGMLASKPIVDVVADFLQTLDCPVVLDPVLRSSSGKALLDEPGLAALINLLPSVDWITPNTVEFDLLGGESRLQGINLVVTGGHLDQPNDLVLETGKAPVSLQGQRIETKATHGTGCAFSSTLLCNLVTGQDGVIAARNAKEYVRQAMLRAEPIGSGNGPMNLLWPLGC